MLSRWICSKIIEAFFISLNSCLNIVFIVLFGHVFAQKYLVKPVFKRNLSIVNLIVIIHVNVCHFLFVLLFMLDHHVGQKWLFIEFQIDLAWLWKQCVFQLILLSFSVCELMITDYSLNHLFTLNWKLFCPEKLNSDSLTQWVKVLVQKEFLHLLINWWEFIPQNYLHHFLVSFCWNVNFGVINHVTENLPEWYVNFLSMNCNRVNETTNYLLVFRFVVPT